MLTATKTCLKSLLLIIPVILFACYPVLEKEARYPEESLVPVHFLYPTFRDDMDRESLISAIRKNIEYLGKLDPEKPFHYGSQIFTSKHVRESQEAFLKLLIETPEPEALNKKIREHFLVYRSTGRAGNNQVLFTGYFEPVFEASLTADDSFKYPIYSKPDDLITTDLSLFKCELKGEKIVGRIDGQKLVPYFSRYQIDEEHVLKGRNLEIAWLKDPVDVAFLQIQGSGRLKLPKGNTINVGYSASNGLRYRSIGRYMIDKGILTREKVSMQSPGDLYVYARAWDTDGTQYRPSPISQVGTNPALKMSQNGDIYTWTIWPEKVFDVPAGKTIDYMQFQIVKPVIVNSDDAVDGEYIYYFRCGQ